MCTRAIALSSLLLLFGCGGEDPAEQPDAGVDDVDDTCPSIFAQSILPEYHVTISAADRDALDDEFSNRVEREAAGLDPEPYHPVAVEYVAGDERIAIPQTLLRLKGASSWLQTISFDANPKMQFVLAFNELDPAGRFRGVRKVELDMPRTDQTFLRQRAGLYGMRLIGVPAQCANSARLYLNGEYYGLYTHLERLDKEFLQRNFGEDDDGDLWKSGRIIKTNEDTFSWDRVDELWHGVETPADLDAIADVDASLLEWAAEAVIGDADGYYNGRANFFLYDHPTRGFIWLPHDLDTTLDRDFLAVDATPIVPPAEYRWEGDWRHYLIMMADPAGAERYVDAVTAARAAYDPARLQARIDEWQAQIGDAAAEDPHRPFTEDAHHLAVASSRDYAAGRAEYIDAWLSCRAGGGADADGDGLDFCHECNDRDPDVHPGAAEQCDGLDQDCNGLVDDGITCE